MNATSEVDTTSEVALIKHEGSLVKIKYFVPSPGSKNSSIVWIPRFTRNDKNFFLHLIQ